MQLIGCVLHVLVVKPNQLLASHVKTEERWIGKEKTRFDHFFEISICDNLKPVRQIS